MIAILLSTALTAASTSATTQVRPAQKPIVIVGQRIGTAKADLDACIARRCPADQDIDATLRLAETQILAGKYRDARDTLLRSLGRNKGEAKRYPIPVSDLYRANGRVAAHLGFDKDYYSSTWGIYRTLKDGLPSAEDRHFSALIEVAEMMGRTRGHDRARTYYESIAKQARQAGRQDIAAIAELRSAIRHLPPGSDWQRREIRRIANLEGGTMRAPVLEARLALARMAYEKSDEQAAQYALGELAKLDIKRPILIYAPSFEMVQAEQGDARARIQTTTNYVGPGSKAAPHATPVSGWSSTKRMAGSFDDMWVDVAFRITPDGKVADARITRSDGDLFWAEPLMASIRARRYTPGKDNDPASQRVERYTYTSAFEAQTGTRLADRSPNARVEYFDLSPMGIATP